MGSPIRVEHNTLRDRIALGFLDWRANLGPEKVTNGSFTGAATGWTLGSGWTYNANAVDRDGAGTATMTQSVGAVAGEIYRVIYTISAYTDGNVTVSVGGVSGTARSSAATFTEYIKATGTGDLTFTPSAASTFTLDTVSVKKVGYLATDGVVGWIDDRGATAGKGALHLWTEDGTGHVIGDRVGLGTLYPSTFCEINGVTTIQGSANVAGGGTNARYLWASNTGGDVYFGVERSTGGAIITDSQAYAGIIAHNGNYPIQFAANNALLMTLTAGRNLVIGGTATAVGTNAVGVLGLYNGTVPASAPADMIQIYSTDGISGSTTVGIYQEAAVVASTVVATRTIPVVVNGTTYYVLANTVAS